MVEIRKILKNIGLNEGVLNEASFSETSLKKASDLLAIVLGRQLGSEFKLLGGSLGKETFKKSSTGEGQGFKYINDRGNMIRFGWLKKAKKSQFQINVVDYWDSKDGKKRWDTPTLSIAIADWMNIVEVVQELKDIIISGGLVSESALYGKQKGKVIFEAIKDSNKPPRKMIQFGQAMGIEYDEATDTYQGFINKLEKAGKWDKEAYVGFKVVKSEVEKNSTEDVFKGAEKLLSEKKYSDPNLVFDDIVNLTKIVATGGANGLIVAGMAGIGKTFGVETTMQSILGSPNGPTAKWRHRKGAKLSPFGLYMDLFMNRSDMTLVYDDSDSVWNDKDSVNILKSAIDTYKVRTVSWPSRATVNLELMEPEEKEEYMNSLYDAMKNTPEDVGTKIKLPSEFDFSSRIIFISNMPGAKFDSDPNLSAIKSRSFFMDVQLKREDLINRIKTILPYIEPSVNIEEKLEILEQLSKSEQTLTMRAVVAAIAIKKSGTQDWERLVREYA